MTVRKFRWGIIGVGKIAGHFARDLALAQDAELYAVASRSRDRAVQFAAAFGVPHAFSAYEAMLTAGVDAVYVATRHPQHRKVAEMCLPARIPVLCEKPLAMNGAEVNSMIETTRRNNTFLMEAIWTRFLPSFVRLREVIDRGTIGDILCVKADFGFNTPFDPHSRLFNKSMGGGALLDIGIYPLFLAQMLLGNPSQMNAVGYLGETGVDEEIHVLLQYSGEKFANLHATLRNKTACVAHIYGTSGSITLHPRWHETQGFTVKLHSGHTEEYNFNFGGAKGYLFEIQHVMNCVLAGKKQSDLLPLNFSRDLMKVMDTVKEKIGLTYD